MKLMGERALRSALVAALLLSALAVMVLSPSLYRTHLQEDGAVEWATFFSFVFAAALAFLTFARTRGRTLERLMLLGLGLFSAFVAGEEISWGQRLLGFQPPAIFLEHNYQQETNLHNFLKTILDTRWIVLFIAVAYGLAAPLFALRWPRLRAASPDPGIAPGFAIVAVLEALYPIELAGELAELMLGMCFLADISLRAGVTKLGTIWAWQSASLLTGLIGAPLIERATYGDESVRMAECRAELNELELDLRHPGQLTEKLLRKRRVHKRLFTAVRARHLRLGQNSRFLGGEISAAESRLVTARRDRRGFLLDPWNQPYWVLFDRPAGTKGRLLLYSFGPNRRRDSVLEPLPAGRTEPIFSGDDLGFLVELDQSSSTATTALR